MRFKSCIYFLLFLIELFSCATLQIPHERRRTAIATVEEKDVYGIHGSSYDRFVYYINHQRYEYHAKVTGGVVIGDKCLVEYDYLYPDKKYLRRDSCFFLPNEKTGFTVGILQYIRKREELFEYYYFVNFKGQIKKYKRLQLLENGDPIRNHPQLVNGAKFVVEYWEQNPQRSVLYINRPVKDSILDKSQ